MTKRIKTRARYENGTFKLDEPLDLSNGDDVEIIIIKEDVLTPGSESNLENKDFLELASKNPTFDFLDDTKEDIYSVKDLKTRYK